MIQKLMCLIFGHKIVYRQNVDWPEGTDEATKYFKDLRGEHPWTWAKSPFCLRCGREAPCQK